MTEQAIIRIRLEPEPPLTQLQRAARIRQGAQAQRRPTAPSRTTTQNDNGRAAVDIEAPEILPQQPVSFWATVIGVNTFGCLLFLLVPQLVVAPAIFLGLVFGWPIFAPVMSFVALAIIIFGYAAFVRYWYYPHRPWIPILDTQDRPDIRTMPDGREFVFAQKECGLLQWTRTYVPREIFPTEEEGAEEQ